MRGEKGKRLRTIVVSCAVFLVWFASDLMTKQWVSAHFTAGEVIGDPIAGLIRLQLVHNTGAAWGMFGDSTIILGIVSLIVCMVLIGYLVVFSSRATVLEVVGIALIVAGGMGNALDRFILGFVIDFIEPVFIHFPVFNLADVGVTCGFVILIMGVLLRERKEHSHLRDSKQVPLI